MYRRGPTWFRSLRIQIGNRLYWEYVVWSHARQRNGWKQINPYATDVCPSYPTLSGEIRLTDGFHYKGDFFKNSLEGHGHITFPDDSEYEGAVVDGLRHGQGHYTQGNITYTGGWKCGVRHGTGIMRYSQTSFYDGQFIDGKGNQSFESIIT